MEKKEAHNSHATASEKGANHGFLGRGVSASLDRGALEDTAEGFFRSR